MQGFADARCVCIPLLSLPLPLVPAWVQGLNQSIRAPGTGAQQALCAAQRSAALSGSVHLQPGGELGEEGKPRCPCVLVSLSVFIVTPELWREKYELIPNKVDVHVARETGDELLKPKILKLVSSVQ